MKKLFLGLLIATEAFAAEIPFERLFPRNSEYVYIESSPHPVFEYYITSYSDAADNLIFYSYNFRNKGPNHIVPTKPEGIIHPNRDFNFVSEDHSRSETYLWITDDNGSGKISDLLESILVFFPRKSQVGIVAFNDQYELTLPTGENVFFSNKTHTIIGGVLEEDKLSYEDHREFTNFPYKGEGMIIRVNARGNDPRVSRGDALIYKKGLVPCRMNKADFWTQTSWPSFRYADDEEVYRLVRQKCGEKYLPNSL